MVYAISDLHGCYDEWKTLINIINLKLSDEIYVLGDIVDRGPHPIKILFDFIEHPNVFPIMGNHEFYFLECVKNLPINCTTDDFMIYLNEKDIMNLNKWIANGGRVTLKQYLSLKANEREVLMDYLSEFVLYDDILVGAQRYLLTHSGLANFAPDKNIFDYAKGDYLFDRSELNKSFYTDKTIVFGHTPTISYFNDDIVGRIITTDTYINIDCGCVFKSKGGRLGCIRLDDRKEFYV